MWTSLSSNLPERLARGPTAWVGALEVGAAFVLLAGLTLVDPLGRLLLALGATVVLAVGLRDLFLRPTVVADRDGLIIVDGLARVQARWADVERLRIVTDRRAPLLEVDLGARVVVLGRRRLGAAPYLVLEELEALRADLGA